MFPTMFWKWELGTLNISLVHSHKAYKICNKVVPIYWPCKLQGLLTSLPTIFLLKFLLGPKIIISTNHKCWSFSKLDGWEETGFPRWKNTQKCRHDARNVTSCTEVAENQVLLVSAYIYFFCTVCLWSKILWFLHNYFLPIKLNWAKKISFS